MDKINAGKNPVLPQKVIDVLDVSAHHGTA